MEKENLGFFEKTFKNGKIQLLSFLFTIGFAAFQYYISNSPATFEINLVEVDKILDLKMDDSKIKILYDDEVFDAKTESLLRFKIEVGNDGGKPIKQIDYDADLDLGLSISHGKILDITSVEANSEYLRGSVSPKVIQSNKIIFNKVIFDKGSKFSLSFLVRFDGETPKIETFGKIVGVDEIAFIDSSEDRKNKKFFDKIFDGESLFIYLLRILLYPLSLFLYFIPIFFLMIAIFSVVSFFQKGARKRTVSKYRVLLPEEISQAHRFMFSYYIDRDEESLKRLHDYLRDINKVKRHLEEFKERVVPQKKKEREKMKSHYIIYQYEFISLLWKGELVDIDSDNLDEVVKLRSALSKFMDFLKPQ